MAGRSMTIVTNSSGMSFFASSWAQAARLSAQPSLAVAASSRATALMLNGYQHDGGCEATRAERHNVRAIGGALLPAGVKMLDRLVVVSTGEFDSVYRSGPDRSEPSTHPDLRTHPSRIIRS